MSDLLPATGTPLEPFAYQREGAAWIASRERAGLLDRPGVGKSAQAVHAADLRRARRGLVICPAHLRENWIQEFRKFSVFERRICRGTTNHDFVAWKRGVFDVMVLSYEKATAWVQRFHDHGEFFDFLVVDEFHYLQSQSAARTRAVLGVDSDGAGGIAMWALQAWALTGTIMSNDPANAWTFLRFVGATDLPFATFVRRYFNSRSSTWGQKNRPKPAMVAELRALLTDNSISRTLEQVGHQLPPIHMTTCLVDGDTQAVRDQLAAHPGLDGAIVEAVERGGLSFLDAQHVATVRRLVAEAKAPPYAAMLLDELRADPGRKVVVMGVSRDALATVHAEMLRAGVWSVLVQGGVSEAARTDHVRAFQSDPACRVFVGNMKAAGTGLTLTAAAHIDILESSWVPADNDQAVKRIRRIGQERRQHARFVTLARSLDEVVNRSLAEKTAAIAACQDGEAMLATAESA